MPRATIDQYQNWLRERLRKHSAEIERNIQTIIREHNAKGALYGGATVRRVHRETLEKFEGAVVDALAVLKKAERETGLDARELFEATEAALHDFMETTKAASRPQQLRQIEDKRAFRELLADYDRALEDSTNGYRLGLLHSDAPSAGMSINVGRDMINSGILQASPGANLHVAVNVTEISKALAAFEAEVAASLMSADELAHISADVASIKAQVTKPKPDEGILRQLGKSLRTVTESVIGNGISAGLGVAAAALWKSLGL